MDVHKEAIVIAVLNASGKLVMESIVETQASSILQFMHGLQGELHVTWEEGTWAAWLYDLLQCDMAILRLFFSSFERDCRFSRYLGPTGGNSNALCGIPFWEAKRGLHVEFVCCRFHVDVE
jgi:hypothetical protein